MAVVGSKGGGVGGGGQTEIGGVVKGSKDVVISQDWTDLLGNGRSCQTAPDKFRPIKLFIVYRRKATSRSGVHGDTLVLFIPCFNCAYGMVPAQQGHTHVQPEEMR